MPKNLVGLTGKRGNPTDGYVQARAGKDAAAAHLISDLGFVRIALADAVRDALYALNPWVNSTERVADIVEDIGWEKAKNIGEIRALLQRMGTEAGRQIHGDHLWTAVADAKIAALQPGTPVVVTDIRFPDEGAWILSKGGIIIEIYRPDDLSGDKLGANAAHTSESTGRITPHIQILNDADLPTLYRRIAAAVA